MSTLLITLKGPFQAWSLGSYQRRHTRPHPTKSGVTGLLASACGYERDNLHGLETLRYGCRVVKPGRRVTDLQTMGYDHGKKAPNPLSWHDYLQDAEFLVGIEANEKAVRLLEHAMRHPVYAPYLGRRDCPPAGPIPIAVTPLPLEKALADPPEGMNEDTNPGTPGAGDLYIESGDGETVWDQPYDGREFGSRGEKHIPAAHGDPFDLVNDMKEDR